MAKFSIGTQKRIKIHDNDLQDAYNSERQLFPLQAEIIQALTILILTVYLR